MPPRILLPLIVACAMFMENLDATVLATAVPTIAAEFGESPVNLKLALTSYLLAVAVFIPASGWAADRFGARRVFQIALLVFTASSVFCGLSDGIGSMVLGRVGQGLGGAMMVPVGRLIMLRSVPKPEIVAALAWLTIPGLLGPVIGPPLGGFITTYFDWRWIFWINVPIGVLGFVLATAFFPDLRATARERFDGIGFTLVAVGLATFVSGSTTLGLGVLPYPVVFGLLAVGAILLTLYVRRSRGMLSPILDLDLLRLRTFRASVLGGGLFWIGAGATPFLLPLMLQLTFAMTPLESGGVTFASAVGAIAMKFMAGPILRRFGFRTVLIASALIAGAFTAVPAAFTAATAAALMVSLLLVGGFVRSLQYTALNSIAYAEVQPERMSRATSLSAVVQQLGMSAGISIGAIALSASTGSRDIVRADFVLPFVLVGIASAASALWYWRLPRSAGAEMSGHRGDTEA